jgi:hypothetical protein
MQVLDEPRACSTNNAARPQWISQYTRPAHRAKPFIKPLKSLFEDLTLLCLSTLIERCKATHKLHSLAFIRRIRSIAHARQREQVKSLHCAAKSPTGIQDGRDAEGNPRAIHEVLRPNPGLLGKGAQPRQTALGNARHAEPRDDAILPDKRDDVRDRAECSERERLHKQFSKLRSHTILATPSAAECQANLPRHRCSAERPIATAEGGMCSRMCIRQPPIAARSVMIRDEYFKSKIARKRNLLECSDAAVHGHNQLDTFRSKLTDCF